MLNNFTKIAFVYSGQGSQSQGMLSEIAKIYPLVRETFEEISDTLNFDAWHIIQANPNDQLNQTQFTQPILLGAGVALWRIMKNLNSNNIHAQVLAGHSLGEYAALVCSESICLADAARIVFQRGQLMQTAVPQGVGAMAAVIGLESQKIDEICLEVSKPGAWVSSANYNTLQQTVIAGHKEAVDACSTLLLAQGAKKVINLSVSVHSHCVLMKDAAEQLGEYLQEFKFLQPKYTIIHNSDLSSPNHDAAIKKVLKAQLYSPVRWFETIHIMVERGLEWIVECGPGQVLTGLNRRIVPKSVRCVTISEQENIQFLLNAMLIGETSCP